MLKRVFLKYICLFQVVIMLVCLTGCKKDTSANAGVSIVGKWLSVKQYVKLSNNGNTIGTSTKTNFTSKDFVMYYGDGTGYFSANLIAFSSPSITKFNYNLKGINLTQFTGNNPGIPETITSLTATDLIVHVEFLTTDPNNPSVTDTEINDFYYTRAQ